MYQSAVLTSEVAKLRIHQYFSKSIPLADKMKVEASFPGSYSNSYTTGSFTGVRVIPGCCFRSQEGDLKRLVPGRLAIKISENLRDSKSNENS